MGYLDHFEENGEGPLQDIFNELMKEACPHVLFDDEVVLKRLRRPLNLS